MLHEVTKNESDGEPFSTLNATLNLLAWRIREAITSSITYYTPFCPSFYEHNDFIFSLRIPSSA